MNISDFALGRSPDRPNAPRTAQGTMAILQEGKENRSILLHHLKNQFQAPINFHFGLWQSYIQPNLKARIGKVDRKFPLANQGQSMVDPNAAPNMGQDQAYSGMVTEENLQNLAEQVLGAAKDSDGQVIAETITKEDIEGIYDIKLKVNPNGEFDRQVLTTFTERLMPILQQVYPKGLRRLMSRVWELYDLQGFDDILPERVADIWTQTVAEQTQVSLLELKVKETQLKMALQQMMSGQPPPPDPKVQAEALANAARLQGEQQQHESDMQSKQLDMQARAAETAAKIAAMQQKAELDRQQAQVKMELQVQQAQIKAAQEDQKINTAIFDSEQRREGEARKMDRDEEKFNREEERKDQAAEAKREASEAKTKETE